MTTPIRFSRTYPLQDLNTFGVEAWAEHFTTIDDAAQLPPLAGRLPAMPLLILGSGSNILFTRDYPGTVLLNRITGIQTNWVKQFDVQITCGSGELWDEVAEYAVNRGWWGAENLSLIPGTVGAAVVQNIGAYGAEISNIVHSVSGIDMVSGREMTIPAEACRFGYRSSIFKTPAFRSFFITSVTFRFRNRKGSPNLSYPALADLFPTSPTHPLPVRAAVTEIRLGKLPLPKRTSSAGSFFKNPVVGKELLEKLHEEYPSMPYHDAGHGTFKIPAAWLIEQCGWKGTVEGACGTWPRQPLVIVNYGGATGREIARFAEKIKESVKNKFGILLEEEVIIL